MIVVTQGKKSEGKTFKAFLREFSISVLPASDEPVFFKKPVLLERMEEVLIANKVRYL